MKALSLYLFVHLLSTGSAAHLWLQSRRGQQAAPYLINMAYFRLITYPAFPWVCERGEAHLPAPLVPRSGTEWGAQNRCGAVNGRTHNQWFKRTMLITDFSQPMSCHFWPSPLDTN